MVSPFFMQLNELNKIESIYKDNSHKKLTFI